jgi:hypothetical protein
MGFTIVPNAGARLILATSARCRLFLLLLFTCYKLFFAILLLQLNKFGLEDFCNFLGTGLAIYVVQLVLVVLQIIEFPHAIVIEMYEFITLGTHAKVAFYSVFVGILIIVVIYTVAVGFPLLALEYGKERASVNV